MWLQKGLEDLVQLESLWLDENHISKIDGLASNVNLKLLHLSNNHIKNITGLETLVNLEVLWICSNRIEVRIFKDKYNKLWITFFVLLI